MAAVRGRLRRIRAAYGFETAKAIRRKGAFVGPVLVVIAVVGMLLNHPVHQDGHSDYEFIAKAGPMVLGLLGWLFLVAYCAALVSSEVAGGTVRLVLVRPLLRHEFILAKLLHGMTYALILTLLAAATSWLVAASAGELTGVEFGGKMLYTSRQMAVAYVIAGTLALAPLFAAAAYGVMISVLSRNTGTAVASALGVWILVDLVKYPLGIAPFVFSTYVEAPWQVFANRCDGFADPWLPMAAWCLGTSAVSAAVFFAVSVLVFARRNLQI